VPLPRRLLPALLLFAVTPGAWAQSADSTAARPIASRMGLDAAAEGDGCGAGASRDWKGVCVPSSPADGSLPLEVTLGGTGGGGEGLVSVTAEVPLAYVGLGGASAAALSAEVALGAGSGLRAGVGLAGGIVLAESRALRLGVRVGGWAERSPVGSAYGPAVTVSARIYAVRVVAGAVVAGAPVHYGRVVLEVPLDPVAREAPPFVGIGVEARRYADTGTMVWTIAFSMAL